MFDKNPAIATIYKKTQEISKLDKISAKIYFMSVLSMLATMIIMSIVITKLISLKYLDSEQASILFLIIIGTLFLYCGFKLRQQHCKVEKHQASLIDYISQEEVQLEIINFKILNYAKQHNEVLQNLALKNYKEAYFSLIKMLNQIVYAEQNQISEAQTKKLIAEYELSMKFKL